MASKLPFYLMLLILNMAIGIVVTNHQAWVDTCAPHSLACPGAGIDPGCDAPFTFIAPTSTLGAIVTGNWNSVFGMFSGIGGGITNTISVLGFVLGTVMLLLSLGVGVDILGTGYSISSQGARLLQNMGLAILIWILSIQFMTIEAWQALFPAPFSIVGLIIAFAFPLAAVLSAFRASSTATTED